MADTKLNIQLTAENSQMNSALRASTAEIEATTEAMKATSKQAGITIEQYYVASEAFGQFVDVVRAAPGELAKLTVSSAESMLTFLEYAEALARTSLAFVDLKKDMESIKPALSDIKAGIEEYVNALKNDEFLVATAQAQVYQTRLEGISGSSAAAAQDLENLYGIASGKTGGGFSSDNILEAGISLRELGQSIEGVTPLAIKLAAGAGTDLNKAAVTLGNTFKGLESGTTALQRTFHITRDEIAAAGAELDDNGRIATRTTEELEKMKTAVTGLIESKYGDVLGKQAKTLGSAFMAVENALQSFSEGIGEIYAGGVADFVQGIAGMIEKCKALIPVLKFVSDNLFSFMSPITMSAKLFMYLGESIIDFGSKVKKGIGGAIEYVESFGIKAKDTAVVLTTMAAVAVKTTVALSGMVAANLVFAGIYASVGMLSKGMMILAGSRIPMVAAAFGKLSHAMMGAAALSTKLAAGVVTIFPPLAAALGAAIGLWMVYRSGVKYATEEQKKFNEKIDKAIQNGEKYNDVMGKSAEEIVKGGHSASELGIALEGVRANAEKAKLEYEEFVKKVAETRDLEGYVVKYSDHEEDDLKIAKLKANAARAAKIRDENVRNIRKAQAELRAVEEKTGDSGEKLFAKSKALEERNLKFQEDMAKGLIQTKRQEADETKAIYEQSLKNMGNLQRDINALQARKDSGDGDGASEERLIRFRTMFENMQALTTEYRLKHLADAREAVQEDLSMQREELDHRISLGKAGNSERLTMLQSFLAKNGDLEKTNLALFKSISKEIITIAFNQVRERKEAALATRQAERSVISSKLEDMKYEDSIGKNRVANMATENAAISALIGGQIQDIKDKRDLDLEAQGDATLRAEITKQAEAQIADLLHQETVQLRENKQAHAEMTAQEIQDNIGRIESAKQVLQSKLASLEVKFGKGFDNQDEIRANKEAQLQKEIDTIRSEEKAKLAVETNATRIKDIKIQASNQVKLAQDKHNLEAASFEESLQVKLAQRKIALNDLALSEQETRRIEFEANIRDNQIRGLDVYKMEQKYIQESLDLKLAGIKLAQAAELKTNQSPAEQAKTRRKYADEEKKARLDNSKQIQQMRAKEIAAIADAAEKEMSEQRELLDIKIKTGVAGTNASRLEKQLILDQLSARKQAIEAHGAEAIASGDVKDKARIQRDTQLQINSAIRDSAKALQDVNTKYSSGNTALDKIVKKYDQALADLQQMQGILDGFDREPLPEPPTEEELKNDPMAKSRYEDEVKKQQRKVDKLRKEKEKADQKKERDDQMKAEDAIEADTRKKRRDELLGQGKSSTEATAIVAEESTARRKQKRADELLKQQGKLPDGSPLPKPGEGSGSVEVPVGIADRFRKPAEGAATPGQNQGGSAVSGGNVESLLTQIRDGINILAKAPKASGAPITKGSEKNGGNGVAGDTKKKGVDGKPITNFSLGDTMAFTPFGFPSMG